MNTFGHLQILYLQALYLVFFLQLNEMRLWRNVSDIVKWINRAQLSIQTLRMAHVIKQEGVRISEWFSDLLKNPPSRYIFRDCHSSQRHTW